MIILLYAGKFNPHTTPFFPASGAGGGLVGGYDSVRRRGQGGNEPVAGGFKGGNSTDRRGSNDKRERVEGWG